MKSKILLFVITAIAGSISASGQIGKSSFAFAAIGTDSVGIAGAIGTSTLPRCQPRSFSCSQAFTYTFTGTGNWTLSTNWDGGVVPPASLPAGATIFINPVTNGECVLNTTQTVLDSASVIVKAGKKFRLLNHLLIQH